MKISTLLMGAAVVACGLTASAAEENLLRGAVEGATGNVGGADAPAVQAGWQYWVSSYEWDSNMDSFKWGESENLTEEWPANVRFENGSTLNKLTYNGAAYEGNVLTLRWDAFSVPNRVWFALPVNIEKPGYYDFKMLAAEWNNYNEGNSQIDNSDHQMFVKKCGIRVVTSDKPGAEWAEYIPDENYEEIGEDVLGNFAGYTTPATSAFFEMSGNGGQGSELNECKALLAFKTKGTNYIQFNGPYAMMVAGGFELSRKAEYDFEGGYDNKNNAMIGGDEGAVEEIGAANVVSTKYYGIDGAEIANPAQGTIVIVKNVLENGHRKVAKRIVR